VSVIENSMPESFERVCLLPRLAGVGGMVSFQHKLAAGLAARGIEVCYDLRETPYAAVLVIGGTRQLSGLVQARSRGVRIVQRLDGMNWLHRIRRTGMRHYLRAEYGNWLLALIRSRLAHAVVYQSEFSRSWWERVRGPAPVGSRVIYNGVDLNIYTPHGSRDGPESCCRILLVEGSLMGGYEMGLEAAVELATRLANRLQLAYCREVGPAVELAVAGRVSVEVQQRWAGRMDGARLRWEGLVPSENIPALDRSAHLLYSADVNAACPNSVIEALACGLPVLSFDTGALPELVTGDAGRVVPYGGDPWRLEKPDVGGLVEGALEILHGGQQFREGARARAQAAFGLDLMVESYLQVLLDG
jgi:glycosyltransferase involved in cell wall biosynthesis